MKCKFTIGVFAVILDKDDRILLCHRTDYDLWNLPGGGLEKGESPWNGVKREVKEETGLDVEITELVGIYSRIDKDEVIFQFKCEVTGGELTLNDEADKLEYFSLTEIPKNTSPNQVARLQDYFDNRDKLHMRVQEGNSSFELIKMGKL